GTIVTCACDTVNPAPTASTNHKTNLPARENASERFRFLQSRSAGFISELLNQPGPWSSCACFSWGCGCSVKQPISYILQERKGEVSRSFLGESEFAFDWCFALRSARKIILC